MSCRFALGTSLVAGLILLAGCNQNTASNQSPGGTSAVENQGLSESPPGNTEVAGTSGTAGTLSMPTQTFAANVAMGDMYEVQSGQIAAMRSHSPDIQQYAQQMVDANTQNLNQLKRLMSKEAPGTDAPTQLDQTRQALLDDLQAANEQQFDARYIAQQIDQHNQALTLMRGYIKSGDDAGLKDFARQAMPVLTMQLTAINAIDRAHHGHEVAVNSGNARSR